MYKANMRNTHMFKTGLSLAIAGVSVFAAPAVFANDDLNNVCPNPIRMAEPALKVWGR